MPAAHLKKGAAVGKIDGRISMSDLVIAGVCERDVDLLLLEEFLATEAFVQWFARAIGIDEIVTLAGAARSVHGGNGESDLELTLEGDSAPLKVLIENKVDALFQPRQAARYQERAADYLAQGACSRTLTVLVAPKSYIEGGSGEHGFDRSVAYEAILEWFASAQDLGPRVRYKQALLAAAINRGGIGWQLVPDERVTTFWEGYWRLASALAPELRMSRPPARPVRSSFIRFSPTDLPKNIELIHKVRHGRVDLQLDGMGDQVFELEGTYGDRLRDDMRIDRAGKSAAIRIQVPEIDTSASLAESEPAVRRGLAAASELLAWYRAVFR
jgi:hypothetical protein